MNYTLIKTLPVFALALGLAACGNSATKKPGGDGNPAIQAASINTTFESECGAGAAAASTAVAFDVTQCQLNPQQLALLQEVGPFKVEADCTRQSIRIKNHADSIVGQGTVNADGTFAVPLTVGAGFNELSGCPVKLEGLASGSIACDAEKRVVKVDVNTAFNFSHVAAEGSALALEFGLPGSPEQTGKGGELPKEEPGKAKEQPAEAPKQEGGKGQPAELPKNEGKGQPAEAPKQEGGKGQPATQPKQETGKGQPAEQPKQETGKGRQDKGQQGKGGGQGGAPGSHVGACVQFAPCAFSSAASLSCSR